ncbi:hypothetical protein O0L34_g6164 [Tuta absoluta]|nr:hypothetical protein O0L34_g6164 [Tuta absoluta]
MYFSENILKQIVLVLFIVFIFSIPQTECNENDVENSTKVLGIEDRIGLYFDSSTKNLGSKSKVSKANSVKKFYSAWAKSRKGFENGVEEFLKESYGASGSTMNVYVNREDDHQKLCDAFLVNDNIINVLFINLFLRELPQLVSPDVAVSLAHNVLRIETKLSKMFLDADYILMRNQSDVRFEVTDALKSSPFVRHQVQTTGLVTVVAEDCHLVGEAIITLVGITPHIGISNFRITECQFSVEISQPGSPVPPVIAPYFTKSQRDQLNHLMSYPVGNELYSKLEGVVVSLINNSAVFGTDMFMFRASQKAIFKETEKFMIQMMKELNKASIEKNHGIVSLGDLSITFDDEKYFKVKGLSTIRITEVTMNGLDMAYSSLRGGPIKMAKTKILEELRFYRLQVRGKVQIIASGEVKSEHEFAAELIDVPVVIEINIEPGNLKKGVKAHKSLGKVDVQCWRELISISQATKIMPADSLVKAYLVQEASKAITKHLGAVLEKAIDATDENTNHKKKLNLGFLMDCHPYPNYPNNPTTRTTHAVAIYENTYDAGIVKETTVDHHLHFDDNPYDAGIVKKTTVDHHLNFDDNPYYAGIDKDTTVDHHLHFYDNPYDAGIVKKTTVDHHLHFDDNPYDAGIDKETTVDHHLHFYDNPYDAGIVKKTTVGHHLHFDDNPYDAGIDKETTVDHHLHFYDNPYNAGIIKKTTVDHHLHFDDNPYYAGIDKDTTVDHHLHFDENPYDAGIVKKNVDHHFDPDPESHGRTWLPWKSHNSRVS